MAIQSNIAGSDEWFAGDDTPLVFAIYEADAETPQDITGWTLVWRLKRRTSDLDADALLSKTTSSGIALTTPEDGVCTVSIEDTDTDTLPPGLYHHELKRTNAGLEKVLSYGSAVLKRGVNRA